MTTKNSNSNTYIFQRSITVPDDWSGTLWPRTWCNWPKPNECLTGECGQGIECDGNIGKSPFSSVDITLKGKDGYDSYAVSLKNGYNVGVAVSIKYQIKM